MQHRVRKTSAEPREMDHPIAPMQNGRDRLRSRPPINSHSLRSIDQEFDPAVALPDPLTGALNCGLFLPSPLNGEAFGCDA